MGLSALVQCALVVALLLVKNGVDIELRNVQEAYIPGLQAFPKPTGCFSSSLGNTALAYALGADSTVKWVALHVVLVAAALVLALVMATRTSIAVRSDTLLLLASATAAAAVMISIGKYDPLTFLGGWTIVMARGPWMSGVGALVMALGNPEQAVVAGACLLVVSLAKEFAGWRRRAIWSLAVSLFVLGAIQLWFIASVFHSSRLSMVPYFLGDSIASFVTSLDTELWSWFGAGWFLVLPALLMLPRASR